MEDIAGRSDIEMVVRSFYEVAMADSSIGHFFTKVVALDLELHLPRIVDFWESVLFGVGKYQGNPVRKHIDLHHISVLQPQHFERWLEIWTDTIIALYSGPKADEAIAKAQMMADLMMYKIKASEEGGYIQ